MLPQLTGANNLNIQLDVAAVLKLANVFFEEVK